MAWRDQKRWDLVWGNGRGGLGGWFGEVAGPDEGTGNALWGWGGVQVQGSSGTGDPS